jgi:SOS response regulatory protein OraA/RecX
LRLKAGLAKTGVSRDIADVAFFEILSDEYEDEAFQREIASLESRGTVPVARIIRRLSSLGFRASKIRSYIENRDEIDADW